MAGVLDHMHFGVCAQSRGFLHGTRVDQAIASAGNPCGGEGKTGQHTAQITLLQKIQAVGQHVSEMSNSFAQMLEMGAVLEDVAGTIHVHPTLGEAFHEASLRALGHAIHI